MFNSDNYSKILPSQYPYPTNTVMPNAGELCLVTSIEDVKRKGLDANKKYSFLQQCSDDSNESLLFLVATNERAEKNIHTFSLTEVPNPEPVRQPQIAALEKRLEDKFMTKLDEINNRMASLFNLASTLTYTQGEKANENECVSKGIFNRATDTNPEQTSAQHNVAS